MKEFKIRRGRVRDLDGKEIDGWIVIDKQAVSQVHETVAAQILETESGKALVKAMLAAGVSTEE